MPSTMKIKSVNAGEYEAAPAHGPIITDICGITPEYLILRAKISPHPAREDTPSCILAPPESSNPTTGQPQSAAISMILQIFLADISEIVPPSTVKSCA